MLMDRFRISEPVHLYDPYQFICEIVGLVVVNSNTKAVIVIVSSAYQLIPSAHIYRSALC